MNKQILWIYILIALFVGLFVGYYYEKSKLTTQLMTMDSSFQQQLTVANIMNKKLINEQASENSASMQTSPKPSGMVHGSAKL